MIDIDALPVSFYEYVTHHINDDPHKLALSVCNSQYNFPVDFAITQIQARQKIKNKLHGFPITSFFLFASPLLAEQCTSWPIARFHASLLNSSSSLQIADLTCGLGIDAFALCQSGANVVSTDIDALTSSCAVHNADILGFKNFQCIHADAIEWLAATRYNFDIIFVDPARRKGGNRTYNFHDCSPDIITHLPLLKSSAHTMMIKASSMLDITATLRLIPEITHLYIIALYGECKEILSVAQFHSGPQNADVTAINLNLDGDEISRFTIHDFLHTRSSHATIADTGSIKCGAWLAEPDAAVMKTGAWYNLAMQYPGIVMLHPHTHLFVSDKKPDGFPGRVWQINNIWRSAKDAMRNVKGEKINVATRNYPLTAQQLANKLNVLPCDNANRFLFGATTSALGKIIMEVTANTQMDE